MVSLLELEYAAAALFGLAVVVAGWGVASWLRTRKEKEIELRRKLYIEEQKRKKGWSDHV